MKKFFPTILLIFALTGIAAAWDVIGDITVHDVKARESHRDSIGNVWVSIQADVTNYGPAGRIFLELAGKDNNGYEVVNTLISAPFNSRDNKPLTDLKPIRANAYVTIREWVVKSARRF